MDEAASLHRLRIDLPDKPGALYEIMKVLGELSLNVIAGYTNVLVYYERMTSELVIDARRSKTRTPDELKSALTDRIASLGSQFSLVDIVPVSF